MESLLFVFCLVMLVYRCRQALKYDDENQKRATEQRGKREKR